MKRVGLILALLLGCRLLGYSDPAQAPGNETPRPYEAIAMKIITTALGSGRAYEMLYDLTTNIGPRLSGSPEAAQAVLWARKTMKHARLENVRLEPVMVPRWVRGPIEEAAIFPSSTHETIPLKVTALGGSVGTSDQGITAEVVEVRSFDELKAPGANAKGKIIFFNRAMDRSKIKPMEAYGEAVNQRSRGAVAAAQAGGVAALVRSMTSRLDDLPHTGALDYEESAPKVPAAALSTVGAQRLSELLARDKTLRVRLRLSCKTLPDVESANVLGELVGSEKPNEVIVIGGHLDSWDKGQGAHDDGAGCIHAIEALRLLKQLGLKPKRTLRAVLFMNEENGLRGAKAYAAKDRPGESHVAAIESDSGGFTPRGFSLSDAATFKKLANYAYLFRVIGAARFEAGHGGADVAELARKGVPTLALRVDTHRYFDYHHADSDTIDKVHDRELELGAAALAIMAYVIAEEGL
ncbi:MAG: M20/M25/M40 family metallo-hydrolase [Acidobacteria bacterium]|nr:M20/M25/M40 family metallo-hydrolase [Acidobacteriota bacterium]MBI3658288.1 M20/M25/M40 family metallo-hydrolase [Acidobacteriota bacterium]